MPRDLDLIRFNTLRNALYHSARRRSLERWNKIFNFAVVALGTTAVADVLPGVGVSATSIGGAVAVVGALQLVFDFGGAARTHQVLQKEYSSLLAEIEEEVSCTEERCRQWEGKLVRISADEPPVLRALDAKAYNDAIGAMEWGNDERLVIKWYHQLLGFVIPFEGSDFRKVSEMAGPSSPPAVPAE